MDSRISNVFGPFLLCAVLLLAPRAEAVECSSGALSPIFIIPGLTGSGLRGTYTAPKQARDSPASHNSLNDAGSSPTTATATTGGTSLNQTEIDEVRKILVKLAAYSRDKLQTGNGSAVEPAQTSVCPTATNSHQLQMWLPADPRFALYPRCFYHMMHIRYNNNTQRFYNNTGARVTTIPGGSDGMQYTIFKHGGYDKLAAYISATFGHVAGKNLYALPYDWRLSINAMQQTQQLDRLANQISAAVAKNCGKKAILLGHSMGTIVSLGGLLQNPRFEAWRQASVKGFIALAPPYGGAVPAVATRVSGIWGSSMDSIFGNKMADIFYTASMGMPSGVMLLPCGSAFSNNWVVASTPERNYTVAQLPQLMRAIGDIQSATMYDQGHNVEAIVAKGPVPGIDTFCIYGTNVNTTKSWQFDSIISGQRTSAPNATVVGKGDGTVNLESLRMCSSVTSPERVVELGGTIDHSSILSDPTAHAEIGKALKQMLAR